MALGDIIGIGTDALLGPVAVGSNLLGLPTPGSVLTNNIIGLDQHTHHVERLSTILARNGWGDKNSQLNRQARSVIRRESMGNPTIRSRGGPCSKDGKEFAWGLMQICTVNCGVGGSPKDRDQCVTYLKDPDNNVKVGKALYDAGGWGPWASSGGLPAPTSWDPQVQWSSTVQHDSLITNVGDVAKAALSPLDVLATVAGALLNPSTWARIGKGLLGGGLVVLGIGGLVFVVGKQVNGGGSGVAALAKVVK